MLGDSVLYTVASHKEYLSSKLLHTEQQPLSQLQSMLFGLFLTTLPWLSHYTDLQYITRY